MLAATWKQRRQDIHRSVKITRKVQLKCKHRTDKWVRGVCKQVPWILCIISCLISFCVCKIDTKRVKWRSPIDIWQSIVKSRKGETNSTTQGGHTNTGMEDIRQQPNSRSIGSKWIFWPKWKGIALIVEKAEIRQAVANEQVRWKWKWSNNNLDKVLDVQAKKETTSTQWNVTQLKAYFQLKKNDHDGAASNTKEALVTKCLSMSSRVSPEYRKEDNNNNNNEDNDDKNKDNNENKFTENIEQEDN